MKISERIVIAVILPLLASCSYSHLINDREYRERVESSFLERKELASGRAADLFSVFSHPLSLKQKEALEFMYAYMPLSDLADYNGDFFLAEINMALRTRDESPWGRTVPEQIFLHYVLPCRVNNENLDSFRIVYYNEIMSRVKNKSILDAALEINHWCHEKVSYEAADIRTSAPMSTILSARGRCGEESTFTVAALRTAGIPARQVYTPRWAHTDDNHAWVEIWSGGKWFYLGACEPEPVIDRGWFTEPARRAMLVHTRSFGPSLNDENAIIRQRNFTEINNLAKYAVTKTIYVKVTDTDGNPVRDARVEYQLYNYAEFYPLAVVPSDEKGISRLKTGLGDLLIWASLNNAFNYQKVSVGETDTLHLVLNKRPGGSCRIERDLDVPAAPALLPETAPELVVDNTRRLNEENEIRRAYTGTWMKAADARMFATGRHMDTARVAEIFKRSMGNFKEIREFLTDTPDSLMLPALSLLELLPDKDLRDTRAAILSDHLINSYKLKRQANIPDRIFLDYILNPRIANEILSPWRVYFRNNLPGEINGGASSNPLLIAGYLERTIRIDNDDNYYQTPITPVGVNSLKVSDTFSRAICFVAVCRSLGIPSRLEPGSNVPQYYINSGWNDLFFSDQKRPSKGKGLIRLITAETRPEPEYYFQFTLARFDNGRYNTLEYGYNRKVSDFKEELSLAAGSYMLVTGNRLPSGRILTDLSFFDLGEGEHKTVEINIRKENESGRTTSSIDLKSILSLFDQGDPGRPGLKDKGIVILWVDPDKEPTKHIINDLPHLKKQFDEWGGYFLFLTDPGCKWDGFTGDELKLMPARVLFGHDTTILKSVNKTSGASATKLPFVVVADKNGNILYSSSGYRIGIGEDLLRFAK